MAASIPHTEQAFVQLIVSEATGAGGWKAGADYDADSACIRTMPSLLCSTPRRRKKWDRLVMLSGGEGVRSPSSSPVAAETAASVCDRLYVSAPSTGH